MHLIEQFLRFSCWNPKELGEAVVGHLQPSAIIEIFLIEAEAAVIFKIDQMIEDCLREARLAIRGEAHNLVFAGVDPETGKIGEGRIKQTKRVREMNLLQHRNLVPGAQSGRSR